MPPEIRDALTFAQVYFQQQLARTRSVWRHLYGRGFSGKTLEGFGMGYAPPESDAFVRVATEAGLKPSVLRQAGLVAVSKHGAGRATGRLYDVFPSRIMIPLHDEAGVLRGFAGRYHEEHHPGQAPGERVSRAGLTGKRSTRARSRSRAEPPPKYLNSSRSTFFPGNLLYGLWQVHQRLQHQARASQDLAQDSATGTLNGTLILCEGYFDVLALAEHDFPPACALATTELSRIQIARLIRFTERHPVTNLLLLLDSDPGGRNGAERAMKHLERDAPALSARTEIVTLPDGEDPASMLHAHGAGALRKLLPPSCDSSPAAP